jgi:hypothetical protein
MSISNQLAETTLRIEVQLPNGISTGTGFLFNIHQDDNGSIPILVTNKHVVRGGISGKVIVAAADSLGREENVELDLGVFPSVWRDHPDQNIDLTAMPVVPILNSLIQRSLTARIKCLSFSEIPTEEELQNLSFVEDVLMVGYPNGLWDDINNYPLFRRGVTSTHPGKDFRGKKEFVVDIAAFPGSSGSPVFLFNEGSYSTPTALVMGSRVKLLGILYAGPQYRADGEIIVQTVPTTQVPVSQTSIPMNLGYVISSQEIEKFKEIFPL